MECGTALIFKNNEPILIVSQVKDNAIIDLTDTEKFSIISSRVFNRCRDVFVELAQRGD
jgi:hypothetical protein